MSAKALTLALKDPDIIDPIVLRGTYHLIRDPPNAKVYLTTGEAEISQPSHLISEDTPSFNPLRLFQRQVNSGGFQRIGPGTNPPAYYLQYAMRYFTIWDGPGPKDANGSGRRVLIASSEAILSSSSTLSELGGQLRETQKYKTRGPEGDPWWSWNRTLVGFDGELYLIKKTSIKCHLTLIREADKVIIVHYHREMASMLMGILELKEPVALSLFHLILGAIAHSVSAM